MSSATRTFQCSIDGRDRLHAGYDAAKGLVVLHQERAGDDRSPLFGVFLSLEDASDLRDMLTAWLGDGPPPQGRPRKRFGLERRRSS